MKIRDLHALRAAVAVVALCVTGCATEPGDAPDCPDCNGTTELLVGARCVPIADVAVCGPDGHLHGDACHCFSGQEPTTIAGQQYCVQQGCGGASEPGDPDALACDEVDREPEQATAVGSFADFESVHIEDGRVTEISLPAGQESFVHCAALAAGHLRVDLSVAGALTGAFDANETALELEGGTANADCPTALPGVHEVHLEEGATYPHPVVLRFEAATAATVRVIVRSPAGE